MTVLAAQPWTTNGHLIAAVWKMHVTARERPWVKAGRPPVVMDVTYGRGIWWNQGEPEGLIRHDRDLLDGVDFRDLPEADGSIDVIAYDPPYVSVGGRATTGTPEFHHRFGLTHAPKSPQEMQRMIDDGLDELARVLRPGGLVLVKCADYVSSGKLFLGSHLTWLHSHLTGWKVLDRFDMIGSARPQPPDDPCRHCIDGAVTEWNDQTREYRDVPCPHCNGDTRIPRRQVHARQNRSTLFVLTRG